MILVSTVIPVYNGAFTVRAAVESALAQDLEGQTVIIANDGLKKKARVFAK